MVVIRASRGVRGEGFSDTCSVIWWPQQDALQSYVDTISETKHLKEI